MPTAIRANVSSFAADMELFHVPGVYSAQTLATLWREQSRYGSGKRSRALKFGCCGGMQSRAQKGRSHIWRPCHIQLEFLLNRSPQDKVYIYRLTYAGCLQNTNRLGFRCQRKFGFQMIDDIRSNNFFGFQMIGDIKSNNDRRHCLLNYCREAMGGWSRPDCTRYSEPSLIKQIFHLGTSSHGS